MFKKILLFTFSFLTTSICLANAAPYVGASVGVTANTEINVTRDNFYHSSFRGMPFAVFLGYGAVISANFYIGAEVTGTAFTAELNDNGLKTSYGYGFSVLPGFLLCDHTLTYIRLGILSARFPSVENSSTGGQAGLGLQTSLTQNVDIRGEYDYIAYKTIADTEITPRADQFVLSFIYKFD